MLRKIITDEKRTLYEYGIGMLLETLACMTMALIIAIVMNEVISTVVFFVVLILLRTYAGGYHCQKFWQCFIVSSGTLGLCLLTIGKVKWNMTISGITILIAFVLLFAIAPVESQSLPISEKERKCLRQRLLVSEIVILIIAGVVYKMQCTSLLQTISIATALVCISAYAAKVKNKSN